MTGCSNALVQEQRLADVLNLWDRTAQVESFAQNDFKDFLHVDAVAGGTED